MRINAGHTDRIIRVGIGPARRKRKVGGLWCQGE